VWRGSEFAFKERSHAVLAAKPMQGLLCEKEEKGEVMTDQEDCPGVEFDDDGDILGECKGTPSKAVVLWVTPTQPIETTLLYCDTCADNNMFSNAQSTQVFDHIPKLKRKVELYFEMTGKPTPPPHKLFVSFMRPKEAP
jgi:hypothetical protein